MDAATQMVRCRVSAVAEKQADTTERSERGIKWQMEEKARAYPARASMLLLVRTKTVRSGGNGFLRGGMRSGRNMEKPVAVHNDGRRFAVLKGKN